MMKLSGLIGSNGALAGVAVSVAAAAIGGAYYVNQSGGLAGWWPVALPASEVAVQPQSSDDPAASGVNPNAVESDPSPADPALDDPSFDVVRVESDGTALVAGRAVPGALVTILLDGVEVDKVRADATGSFVSFLSLGRSDDPRVLTLLADGGRGSEEVILAPRPGPDPNEQVEPDVGSPDAPLVVLRSDAEGVELLQPAMSELETPDRMLLDTIGYSDTGAVELSGRAATKGHIHVYLDNRSVIQLPVSADGRWRGSLPDVDAGVYDLRLDEIAADGMVASRIETPFKREAPEVLSAALAQQATGEDVADAVRVVTVQTGATLWAIARDTYGEGVLYVRVFEANRDHIRDPDLIYPGQVFTLPGE